MPTQALSLSSTTPPRKEITEYCHGRETLDSICVMSNYPPTQPGGSEYQGQYRPVPPPPLPPRRPLSQYGERPENSPPTWQSGQGSAATPAPLPADVPPIPDQRPYTSYGGESMPQYAQQFLNSPYNAFTQQSQSTQLPQSNATFGQNSAYTPGYGQSPPIQQSPYGQLAYGQGPNLPSQPYGYGMNPALVPSPYGQSASPPLNQPSFAQNSPFASPTYVSEIPPPTALPSQSSVVTGSMNNPNLLEFQSAAPMPRPVTSQSSSARPQSLYSVPTPSSPANLQTQTAQPATQNVYAASTIASATASNTPRPQTADPHPKPYRRYSSEVQSYTTPPSQPPKYQNPLPAVSSSSIPAAQPSSPPPPPPAVSTRPQVFNVSSPLSSKPPIAATRPTTTSQETNLINIGATSPPRQQAVPAKIPGTATRKQSAGQAQAIPVSVNITEPVYDQTRFLESSFERYKEVLRQEMGMTREGRHADVISLLREFVESEIKMRLKRYRIPEEIVQPVPEPIIPPVSTTPTTSQPPQSVVPAKNEIPSNTKPRSQDLEASKQQQAAQRQPQPSPKPPPQPPQPPLRSQPQQHPPTAPVQPRRQSNEPPPFVRVDNADRPAPPSTFSAILSQTSSYIVSPPQTPAAEIPAPPTPPPPPKSPFRAEVPTSPPVESIQQPPEPPKPVLQVPKKFKEYTVPPIPKSVALAQILSSVPQPLDEDPTLTPLRDRLFPLKNMSWLETDQQAFDDREHKIESEILEDLGKRQEAQSLRETNLYAANKWEQADQEAKNFQQETQRQKEEELRQSLLRWRSEYCDPSYEKLHGHFSTLSSLHKEITQLEGCENVDQQVTLLNETEDLFLGVMQRLDVLTDELRRRQHRLKVSRVQATDDWDLVNQFDREKEEEDNALKEQRGEFKLEKVRLHGQCVKYLVENGVEILTGQNNKVKKELERILETLPGKATSDELPSEDSTDAYPSDELIAQFGEASIVLNSLHQRINTLYSLLQQKEYDLIGDETAPAINKAFNSHDWNGGEKLRAEQAAKLKQLVDTSAKDRQARDEENKIFSDLLARYVTAHNGRRQARLKAIAYGPSADSGSAASTMTQVAQEQMKAQMVSNAINSMSRTGAINNIGGSNTRHEYVYK